uniref:Uncharacterized protein n=1 Tax=Glossina pallidipes TaxID=7398 RepID=A0A1B0A7E2_GLOPL
MLRTKGSVFAHLLYTTIYNLDMKNLVKNTYTTIEFIESANKPTKTLSMVELHLVPLPPSPQNPQSVVTAEEEKKIDTTNDSHTSKSCCHPKATEESEKKDSSDMLFDFSMGIPLPKAGHPLIFAIFAPQPFAGTRPTEPGFWVVPSIYGKINCKGTNLLKRSKTAE